MVHFSCIQYSNIKSTLLHVLIPSEHVGECEVSTAFIPRKEITFVCAMDFYPSLQSAFMDTRSCCVPVRGLKVDLVLESISEVVK